MTMLLSYSILLTFFSSWSSGPAVVNCAMETDFLCPDEFGYYAHPTDCSLYYVCVFGGSLLESCSGGLMYSNTLQTCDWPRNVECVNGVPGRTNVTVAPQSQNQKQPVDLPSATRPASIDAAELGSSVIEEYPQQRLSRSYAGAQPNFKNYQQEIVPVGRRVKRQTYNGFGYPHQAQAHSLQVRDNDYYYEYEDIEQEEPSTDSESIPTGHGQTDSDTPPATSHPDKSISSKLVQVQRVTPSYSAAEYEDASDYISQRYAANISNKVEEPAKPEYEYYYDYEEPQQENAITSTTSTTTTPKPIPVIRHHITQQPQPPPRRRPGVKPTLLPPAAHIIKGASTSVRNIFTDPPSRPDPIYATPEPNSPAAKCPRASCVIPDCNCGGKDIPGGLDVTNTPQLVILTFDDSVNDLNKNLYKDLFEVGRKNPNGCPISATFYVSHEWTDYSQVQNLAADGHEIASHSVSHSFGEQFSTSKWTKEINGQREILSAYGGVKLNSVRGMRAPFLAIGGNNMFKMLYDANFTYDSSMPVYENNPPSWPYTLDYKIFHQCMIPPCPTKSFPGVWEVPMVMWQDLKGGRCSMGDACSNPATAQGVYEMLVKNFERHYTTNRAPFGLYYHAAWFTQAHHKEGFESFLDVLVSMEDVWLVTNWQALQWIRNPVGINEGLLKFPPFDCRNEEYKANLPKRCTSSRVCNLWHKSGVRYMKTCQNCPEKYPWTGATGV